VECQSDSRLYSEVVGKLWGETKLYSDWRLATEMDKFIYQKEWVYGIVTRNQRWSQT
jgi:hypothetical protein